MQRLETDIKSLKVGARLVHEPLVTINCQTTPPMSEEVQITLAHGARFLRHIQKEIHIATTKWDMRRYEESRQLWAQARAFTEQCWKDVEKYRHIPEETVATVEAHFVRAECDEEHQARRKEMFATCWRRKLEDRWVWEDYITYCPEERKA